MAKRDGTMCGYNVSKYRCKKRYIVHMTTREEKNIIFMNKIYIIVPMRLYKNKSNYI